MKWGSKKSSKYSSSSSSTSVIGRVFPVSWFSKFKQRGGDSVDVSGKMKQRGDKDCSMLNSSLPARWKEGRFYSMDGDWRLSFGEERVGGRRSTVGINPLWNDSNKDFQVPVSRFKNFGLKEIEENQNFNDMVLGVKKTKEKKVQQENGAFGSKKVNGEGEFMSLRRKVLNDRKLCRGVVREQRGVKLDEGDGKASMAGEKDIFVMEPDDIVQMKKDSWNSAVSNSRKHHRLASIEEDYAFEALNGEGCNSEWQNLEDEDIKEVNVKPETPRKSTYICRESRTRKVKHSNRVGAYSPRTECKIRALEDMKTTRKKKATREQMVRGRNNFNSFATVKSSFNPEQDFRDSMVEMIRERGIRRAEELEELLACYLSLNSDEHHHLIIKVFRQVWFELYRM